MKNQLLSDSDKAQANAAGWDLFYVYSMDKSRWAVAPVILPGRKGNSQDLLTNIVQRARQNDKMAIRVLALITAGVTPAKRKAKK